MIYIEQNFISEESTFNNSFLERLYNGIILAYNESLQFDLVSENVIKMSLLGNSDEHINDISNTVISIYKLVYNADLHVETIYYDKNYNYADMSVSQLYNRLKFMLKQCGNVPVKLIDNSQSLGDISVVRICNKDTISLIATSGKSTLRVKDLMNSIEDFIDFERVFLFGLKFRDTLVGISKHEGYLVLEGKLNACFPKNKRDFM